MFGKSKRRLNLQKPSDKNQKEVENEEINVALILAGGQGTVGNSLQNACETSCTIWRTLPYRDSLFQTVPTQGLESSQYQPLALNNHIGNSSSWGLDGINSGVSILQPYSASEGNRWFEGTLRYLPKY